MNTTQERTSLPYELAGASAAVQDCLAQVDRAAADDRNVLITAEHGLDAEAVARTIHERSPRRKGPFVAISAEGRSAAELERLLFGAQPRAAANGTDLEMVSLASALFRADRGVLFIAGLSELPALLQRRLARLLRDGAVRVPRRTDPVMLDVRVIGATDDRLDAGLREDLIRRLPAVVEIPPLRHRRDDVPAIASAMLAARDRDKQFTPAALTVLSALPWRRNTAELSGLLDRLTAAGSAALIRQEDVLAEVQLDRTPARPAGNLREARRQFERDFIAAVLREHAWEMRDAARALGIERANLYRKVRQLGIPLRKDTPSGGARASR